MADKNAIDKGNTVDDPEDLKAQLAEMKQRLDDADKRVSTAEQQVRRSKSEVAAAGERVQQSELQIVSTAIETLTAQGTSLEEQYAKADEEGNSRLKASIARQMAKVETQLTALEAGKQRLEIEAKEPKPSGVPQPVPGETPSEFLAKQLPPRAAAWIRRNPEYAEGRLYNKMLGAHNVWIADNPGTEETDDYFKAIEDTLGFVNGKPPTRPGAAAKANGAANGNDGSVDVPLSGASSGKERSGDTPPPAAPGGRTGGGNGVRLTLAQKEAAAMSGVSEEEYAKSLATLRKDGRLAMN